MKSLKDYTYEQSLNEGLGDLLKGFWEWLTGKNNKEEYDSMSSYYDEEGKKKYIGKFTSDKVKAKNIEKTIILDRIIYKAKEKDEPRSGFYQTEEFFKKHPEAKKISTTNKWISFIFDSDDLIESCGLIVYKTDDSKYTGKNVVYFSDFLPIYKTVINYGYVYDTLKKLDGEVIIKDKKLIKAFKADELELNEVEKGIYSI